MRTTKKGSILDTLLSQIDKREYNRVKSRMGLAAKISDTLKEKGISQKEFAKKLGKKPSEISKWLTGTHNFTLDTLVDIQSILGIELINCEKPLSMAKQLNKMEVTINVTNSKDTSFVPFNSSFSKPFGCISKTSKHNKNSLLH